MIKVTTDSSSKYLTEIGAISRGNEVIAIWKVLKEGIL